MKIVVIEDELLIAEDLIQTILAIAPDVSIVKHLKSVRESVAYLQLHSDFDLIFSDIQLGDGLSFEIFQTVYSPVPIVFCTAYDAYLLDAFQANGIAYLLKPIGKKDVQQALEKYKNLEIRLNKAVLDEVASLSMKAKNLGMFGTSVTSIIVHQQDKIIPLLVEEIALCYIEFENVFIKTFDGKEYMTSKSLEELEQILINNFFRANRQHLITRKTIKHASYTMARKLHLSLHIPHACKVQVSREKAPLFLRWLEGG